MLKKHPDELFKYFRISVSEDNKRVPSIYWLPRLYKNPAKAKFIWTILNNQPVINALSKFSVNATSTSCFDFSSLYTNIPHGKPMKVLNELIDFSFKREMENRIC